MNTPNFWESDEINNEKRGENTLRLMEGIINKYLLLNTWSRAALQNNRDKLVPHQQIYIFTKYKQITGIGPVPAPIGAPYSVQSSPSTRKLLLYN